MNFDKLTTTELIERYSQILSLLKDRKVIRTKNLLGDLAEYLVINHYIDTAGLPNLQAAPPGTQNVDALSRHGERYSIKATTGNLTGVFYGLNPPNSTDNEVQKFEYVIIACFDNNFKLKRILELKKYSSPKVKILFIFLLCLAIQVSLLLYPKINLTRSNKK